MIQAMIDFYIVNFPFLNGDVPPRPSYGVYVYVFLNVYDFLECVVNVDDFYARNKC